jgi:hypothetical protein
MFSSACTLLALCGSLCCTYALPFLKVPYKQDGINCIDAFGRKTIFSEGCSEGTGLICTNNCRIQHNGHVLKTLAVHSGLAKRFNTWKLQLQDSQEKPHQILEEAASGNKKTTHGSGDFEYSYLWQQPVQNGTYKVNSDPA